MPLDPESPRPDFPAFTTAGSVRDLRRVRLEDDPQLQEITKKQRIRELCRGIRDEAHFQTLLAACEPHLRDAVEADLRPLLPWTDPNPPAVPINPALAVDPIKQGGL